MYVALDKMRAALRTLKPTAVISLKRNPLGLGGRRGGHVDFGFLT
jgi:hypothetical protein